jgi:hypothetical protein
MYIIEITLRGNPLSLSVQRKEKAGAHELYHTVSTAMKTGLPQLLELTCDRSVEKKVAVLSSEVSAVQVSEKSASGVDGTIRPGFFATGD